MTEQHEQYQVTVRAPQMVMTTQDYAERRRAFDEFVSSQMKQDIDYGTIPHTQKPTLYKPGAEKIARMYGVRPQFTVEWQEADPATGYFTIKYRCQLVLVGTDHVMAEGLGLCSSFEKKYRWRKEWWNVTGNPPDNEGWEKTKGNKFFRNIPNPDLVDTWNTVDKMSQKRSLVAASLCISGASERFTQDMEDFADEDQEAPPQRKSPQKKANGKRLPRPWPPEELRRVILHNVTGKGWDEPASPQQVGLLAGKLDEVWAGDKGATANRHEFTGYIFGKRSAKELTKGEASVILDWLLDEADSTGEQPFKAHAREEANLVLRQAMIDQGQQEMPLDDGAIRDQMEAEAPDAEQDMRDTFGNVEGRDA